jgi:hypothetical protein
VSKKILTREELRELAMWDLAAEYSPVEESFYESSEWRELSKSYLQQHPFCELCREEGTKESSDLVHHIIPIRKGGEQLDEDNLMALCEGCHSDLHGSGGISITSDFLDPDFEFPWDRMLKRVKVEAVHKQNPDGVERQEIIAKCVQGEPLKLVRLAYLEIGVFRESGEQIGHIDKKLAYRTYLDSDLTHDMEFEVEVLEVIGEPGRYDCIIQITRGDYKYEPPDSYMRMDRQWTSRKFLEAKFMEKDCPDEAILAYRKIMKFLKSFDELCRKHGVNTWRVTRHPINRLTLVLERQGKYQECLEEIEKYEQMRDEVGLYKTERESLQKRKSRILKKLS